MGAALVVGDGVNLVQYEGPDSRKGSAPALRGQQDVQRLRGGYQDVGRLLCHALPFGCLGVSGAYGSAYIRQEAPRLLGQSLYLLQRRGQVLLNVVGEGL